MVPLAGATGCFVNARYRFDRHPALPLDWKREDNARWSRVRLLSVSDLWRSAAVTRASRLMCRECIPWPKVRRTRARTVWLDGAALLTVTQDGFGIVGAQRPRYAKTPWHGVKLETPQQKPLSHTLWSGVAPVKTVSDLQPVNHGDDAGFDGASFALKAAENSAAKVGSIIWKAPGIACKVVTNPRVEIEAKQASPPSERLDWLEAFLERWEAGDIHPINGYGLLGNRYGRAVRQPGAGEYSPIWYRRRKWVEGDPEGPESQDQLPWQSRCRRMPPRQERQSMAIHAHAGSRGGG